VVACGIPREYVKHNLSVTFCSVLFCAHAWSKSGELIYMLNGSKRVKSGKDVPFGGFVIKISPHPKYPQILKILHYESSLSRKTLINLGESAAKICI